MKEINPLPKKDARPPMREDVTIEQADNAYYVSLPARGRLGDRRLYDAETGRPCNIGPTSRGSEFKTIPEALAHFKRVADAFARFFPCIAVMLVLAGCATTGSKSYCGACVGPYDLTLSSHREALLRRP